MHFLSVITVPSMKDKNIDLDIKQHGKTSEEPGNIEVNYSSKEHEKCKDKHLQDMIDGTLSTEAGAILTKGVTCGAGTTYPSGAPEVTPGL